MVCVYVYISIKSYHLLYRVIRNVCHLKYVYIYVYNWCVQGHDMVDQDDVPVQDHPPTDTIKEAVPTWDDPVFSADADPPPDILLGELLLMYFEWMGTYKVTDVCAKAAYTLLSTLIPKGANGGSWATAQRMLQAIYDQSVVAIDICPNDCIAYYDCKHPKMKKHRHAHRDWCPKCGSDRKVTHNDGTVRSAKQGYYLPCGMWFRDLFKIDGLGPELSQHAARGRPPGHVSKSRGWHKKVQDTKYIL
jgi:hypothetical protein